MLEHYIMLKSDPASQSPSLEGDTVEVDGNSREQILEIGSQLTVAGSEVVAPLREV